MISPSATPPRAGSPAPNAWNAFAGVWHATFPAFFGPVRLVVAVVVLALYGLAAYAILVSRSNWREMAVFYVAFAVPMVAFISGAWAVRQELKSSTVDYVFTRPLPRHLYLPFRYVAQFVWVELGCLAALAVLGFAASSRNIPNLAQVLPWMALAQFLVVAAFTAFGFLCATLTNRYMVVGLVYGGTVEAALGATPIQLNQFSMLLHARTLLDQGFAAGAAPQGYAASIAILLAFAAGMLALASYAFSRKQFAGSGRE